MLVLVDSSVWIEFFRGNPKVGYLDELIKSNSLCTHDVVLSELIPRLRLQKQNKVIKLLHEIEKKCHEINWQQIRELQFKLLKSGINGVGLPDLIIVQCVINRGLTLYSLDKHFESIKRITDFDLIQ